MTSPSSLVRPGRFTRQGYPASKQGNTSTTIRKNNIETLCIPLPFPRGYRLWTSQVFESIIQSRLTPVVIREATGYFIPLDITRPLHKYKVAGRSTRNCWLSCATASNLRDYELHEKGSYESSSAPLSYWGEFLLATHYPCALGEEVLHSQEFTSGSLRLLAVKASVSREFKFSIERYHTAVLVTKCFAEWM